MIEFKHNKLYRTKDESLIHNPNFFVRISNEEIPEAIRKLQSLE